MSRLAWVRLVIVLLGLLFAVQGGEYSLWNWWELRRAEAREQAAVADLIEVIDSLEPEAVALERDPKTQERAAREAFGMIREGEFLFRVIPPAEP
ncbi:MAG TPA: septum formation initiator family protein [Gemmatimonadales bacterium]|nr:septum formation initiator family protein [Gemmatimonadales bacterium]